MGDQNFLSSILEGGKAILGLENLIFLCILLVCKRQVVCIGIDFSGAKREGPTGEHIAGGVHLRIVDLEVGRL